MKTPTKPLTPSKPLSAFEVYALKKTPEASPRPSPSSRNRIKKQKRRDAVKAKKLKKAGVLTPEVMEGTSRDNVVVRMGAVKPKQFGKKKKEKGLTQASNGLVKKNLKTRSRKDPPPPSVENGNGSPEDGKSATKTNKKSAGSMTKPDFKRRKVTTERGNLAKENRNDGDMDRQSDLKKKIAEVKRLVSKKTANKSKDTASDENCSDQSFDSEGSDDEFGEEEEEVIESDGLENGDGLAMSDGNEEEDEFTEGVEIFEDMASYEDEDISDDGENSDDPLYFDIRTYCGSEIKAANSADSRTQGRETFQWLIKPHTEKSFFSQFWEKKPLLIKRKERDYYKGLFSTQDFDKILHEQVVIYSKNLDVTSYSDGKRETHNPIGQAHAPVVWDYYNNGCSLRMLNPQTFHPRVWKCLSSLQEHFNSFCGANVYLTPPDTQGFAPHWDDIEAFILQLEGKKRWRVYKPRCDAEVLPENSSPNLDDDSIGEPILDTVLEPGDLLYFPRGYIHQGHAAANEHSLHITLSTFQKNSWGHYLEKLLPQALSIAMTEDVEFRRGLPTDYLNYMGVVHSDDRRSEERTAFKKKVCKLVMRMLDTAPLDAAVDQRGTSFMHDCLPPYLTQEDKKCSAYGGGERWCAKKKKVVNRVELQPDTLVRLIRGNCIRLVVAEDDNVNIYHCLENSREYHQEQPQFLEMAADNAPAVEALIRSYPDYIAIESLPLQDEGEKMTVAGGLWERGLLVSAHPLDAQYDD